MSSEDFPIDIQLKKLTDFLHSRRLVSKNWHENVSAVRQLIGSAMGDMPEHPEIRNLLSDTNIHFYNCLAIVEVLKETEKDSKNLFGSYTSQRMKDWAKILKAYEKDNCYLAEASNFLTQAVVYELPSLKRQIGKNEKNLVELDKEEESSHRKKNELGAAIQADCSRVGVKGDNAKKEILELVQSLPELYDHWLHRAQPKLEGVMKKYANAAAVHREATSSVPLLTFLLEHGNKTAYEYIHGEAPLTIEEPTFIQQDDTVEEATEICLELDSVDLDVSVENDQEINWGDDFEVAGSDNVEIDWGSNEDEGLASQIIVEESGTAGGVATGEEAYTLLDNRRLRNQILDELYELSSFCQMRSIELMQEKSFVLNDNLNNAGDGTSEIWLSYHRDVEMIIEELNGPGQLYLLHMVKTSATFVNRLVSEMEHKAKLMDRLDEKVVALQSKRGQTLSEAQELQKTFKRVLDKAVQLQKNVEQDISKRYNNRKVNILGGVQTV